MKISRRHAKTSAHPEADNRECWHCGGCKKYFVDAADAKEISIENTAISKLPEYIADDTG